MSAPTIRPPTPRDATPIWSLVRETGVLDVNSAYLYAILADHHAGTCAVAEADGAVVGFVTGYRVPERPDTWFLWQVGVAASARGQGLAKSLAMHVLDREALSDVRWLETTVSPSNTASRALFRGLARDLGCELTISTGFPAELFPAPHEPEELLRLGPFSRSA